MEKRPLKLSRQANQARLALAVSITIALLWVLWPYIGAIFWSIVLAIVLAPLHRRILRIARGRKGWAGLATLLSVVLVVGVPLALLFAALLRQARGLYADIAAGRIDFGAYAQRIGEALPQWLRELLERSGLGDLASIREKLSASALEASRFMATHLLSIGVNVFAFALAFALMLYLLYVLLSVGEAVSSRIERLSPLPPAETRSLTLTFTTVVRATVKGGLVMAATQGVLGGFMLGFLGIQAPLFWGVVFGVLSMIPAVGAGLLWGPIALYFLVTGAIWKGVVLIVFGVVVLTAVDNILRPLLVGRDTHLPGYLVLMTTLGGIASFGVNGVIMGPMLAAMFVAVWKLFDAELEP
jgi:predicted PurR-regulated permease PerM